MSRNYNAEGVALLTRHLTPEQRQELEDLTTYLGEKAGPGNPTGFMAEGSVAATINRASPPVRQVMARVSDLVETKRVRPYDPKLSEEEHFDMLGLDPQTSVTIKSALDGQYVAQSLQERMGVDTPDQSELSDREIISAAMEQHHG